MSVVNCPECGTACRLGSKFCIQCAFPLETAQTGSSCKRGHKQDPSWTECPFCKGMGDDPEDDLDFLERIADQPVRQHTILEIEPQTPPPNPKPQPAPNSPNTTARPTKQPTNKARSAQVISPQNNAGAPITGVLATYGLKKAGQAWLIRQGRNYIGSAAGAQVRLKAPGICPKHALIFCKGLRFVLDDCLSEGGTWLNGKRVDERTPLKHGDVIQTGETLWAFSTITPPNPAAKQHLE